MATRVVVIKAGVADPDPVHAFRNNPAESNAPDQIRWVAGDAGRYRIVFRGNSPVNGSAFDVPTTQEVTGARGRYSYDVVSGAMAGQVAAVADPDVIVD